jgi:DNA phosphorothioation-associated putative methyltransferase
VSSQGTETIRIHRHKTAIRRSDLSLPIKCALRDGLIEPTSRIFDYGCGFGEDMERLAALGYACEGWDPAYRPTSPMAPAPIVNLGYVLNVIENADERAEVLRRAWELSTSVLVVSALGGDVDRVGTDWETYGDGVLTTRSTFQKRYGHMELKAYLEQSLPADAVPAAPNVYYVFKDEEMRQRFLSRRFRRRIAVPRKRISEVLFEENQDILAPFMEALTRLGRLPGPEELPETDQLIDRFGSLKRAFLIVRRATGQEPWTDIAARRKEDLLVYLALSRFGRRRPLTKLPLSTQRDLKAFVGTYARACVEANELLFSVGKPEVIDDACQRSPVGHLVENALIIRRDTLDQVQPVLRVYEGCARAILGEIEEANVIKLHRFSGKVSYLVCPDLDSDTNPSLRMRVKVNLPALSIDVFDHTGQSHLPRLGVRPDFLMSHEQASS